MKYDYTKKSWNIDAQSLSKGKGKGNKRYLRYIIIGIIIIIIAIVIWVVLSGPSSPKSTVITTSPTATAAKSVPSKTKQHNDYVTIPLKLPNS